MNSPDTIPKKAQKEPAFLRDEKYKKAFPAPPVWRARLYERVLLFLFGLMPAGWQRGLSRLYTHMFYWPASRILIKPFCRYHFADPHYLNQFKPPEGKEKFESFQDFFTRALKEPPMPQAEKVWCCEGNLCHYGKVGDIPNSQVKGKLLKIDQIFGQSIPTDYYFSNVFLHNKNYHRLHAPIRGKITRIQHIPGELMVLRPWIFINNPSLPAFRNERINLDIQDELGRTWHLSIIGGPAVGAISLPEGIEVDKTVDLLQEIAQFHLGSTCCLAAPIPMQECWSTGDWVEVGDAY